MKADGYVCMYCEHFASGQSAEGRWLCMYASMCAPYCEHFALGWSAEGRQVGRYALYCVHLVLGWLAKWYSSSSGCSHNHHFDYSAAVMSHLFPCHLWPLH